jgi:hypothetical protein
MPGGGSRGKLLRSFPPLPPPLEIAARFPHSHSFGYGDIQTHPTENRKEPSGHSTLILQAHPSMRKCWRSLVSQPFRNFPAEARLEARKCGFPALTSTGEAGGGIFGRGISCWGLRGASGKGQRTRPQPARAAASCCRALRAAPNRAGVGEPVPWRYAPDGCRGVGSAAGTAVRWSTPAR